MFRRLGIFFIVIVCSSLIVTTVPSCGGGGFLAPLATIIKYTYKIIRLFKKPKPIAAANVTPANVPADTTAGKTDKATLEVANHTSGQLQFYIDGDTTDPAIYVIDTGVTLIQEFAPGDYQYRSGTEGTLTTETFEAGRAYQIEVIDQKQEVKQTVNQATGVVISEAPTGKNTDQPAVLPPQSEWGTIEVVNETTVSFPQYVDGELKGTLAAGDTGTYPIPPGDHVISNTLDKADPNAAFLWFDVLTGETRTIHLAS